MSNDYLEEIQAEIDKKKQEREMMYQKIIAEGVAAKADWSWKMGMSKVEKEEIISPSAAEIQKPAVVQPDFPRKLSQTEYVEDYIAKMTSPSAAEIKELDDYTPGRRL